MKTTKSILFILLLTSGLAFGQDNQKTPSDQGTNTDYDNKIKSERDKEKNTLINTLPKDSIVKPIQKVIEANPANEQEIAIANYKTPGPKHKLLASFVGEWDQEIKFWPKVAEVPIESKAKCTITMVLGGLYQKSVSKGKIGDLSFEGMGMIGYDNVLKKFQSTWIDDMGTGITNLTGIYLDKQKIYEFSGTMIDPITSKQIETVQNLKIISNDELNLEIFKIQGSQKNRVMEITFKRIIVKKPVKK